MAFSSLARVLGDGLTMHSLPVLFKKNIISGDQLVHTDSTFFFFLGQDQFTVAQPAETAVAEWSRMSRCELVFLSFRFPHHA